MPHLLQQLKEAREEIRVSDLLLAERQKLLDAIPECPDHGGNCIPHALEWIENIKEQNKELLKSLELLKTPDDYRSNTSILTAALQQAVERIKEWRTKAAASSGKSKEVIEEIWHTYFGHAPEMKMIREVLNEFKS